MASESIEKDYYETETISLIVDVEIRYRRGSDDARASAVRLAREMQVNAAGVGIGGCYRARSLGVEIGEVKQPEGMT